MKIQGEITSNCVCTKYDDNGDEMLDANGEVVMNEYCYGDCYTDQNVDFTESLLPMWLEAKGIMKDSPVRILGSGMTWRGVSGHHDTTAQNIIKALEIDGDFTLRITYDDETRELSVVRSSHDELGASFVVVPRPIEDDDTEWE